MPLLFLVAGLILVVTVIRGTVGDFASTLASDFSGGYLKWLAAILVIGGIGYVPTMREPSRYLLALVALVILLTNGTGFITKLVQQLENPGTATTAQPAGGNPNLPAIPIQSQAAAQQQASSGGGGSGGGSNPLGIAGTIAGIIGPFL